MRGGATRYPNPVGIGRISNDRWIRDRVCLPYYFSGQKPCRLQKIGCETINNGDESQASVQAERRGQEMREAESLEGARFCSDPHTLKMLLCLWSAFVTLKFMHASLTLFGLIIADTSPLCSGYSISCRDWMIFREVFPETEPRGYRAFSRCRWASLWPRQLFLTNIRAGLDLVERWCDPIRP
jgi:hypothetical protein